MYQSLILSAVHGAFSTASLERTRCQRQFPFIFMQQTFMGIQMSTNLLDTIMVALEEAEINSPERPWELTMLPLKSELPLSRVVGDLELSNVITMHRNAQSGIGWAELEYLGSEILRVLRTPTLRKELEQRLNALPIPVSVLSVCEFAEEILVDGVDED